MDWDEFDEHAYEMNSICGSRVLDGVELLQVRWEGGYVVWQMAKHARIDWPKAVSDYIVTSGLSGGLWDKLKIKERSKKRKEPSIVDVSQPVVVRLTPVCVHGCMCMLWSHGF